MVAIWDNSLWRTFCVLYFSLLFFTSGDGTRICKGFWVYECDWGINSNFISLRSAMVRCIIWHGTCHLFHARITWGIGSYRSIVRNSNVHFNVHCITRGIWCFPLVTLGVCYNRSTIPRTCFPLFKASLGGVHAVDMVGDNVPYTSLLCGLGRWIMLVVGCILLYQAEIHSSD